MLRTLGDSKLSYFYEAKFPLALLEKETGFIEASIKQIQIVNLLIPYLSVDH
jgi:hypothetical protein